MTLQEANALLDSVKISDKPSCVNPALTQAQAVQIVRDGINSGPRIFDGIKLDPILEKRVYQVVKNQKRPRY